MSEELDRRLRRSAPTVQCEAYTTTLSAMLDDVTARRRRPAWTRPGLGAALAALVFVPSGAVAAGLHFAAETGEYGPSETTETDTSQYIDLCAPDIRDYLLATAPVDLPLPADASWATLADRVLETFQQDCPPSGPGSTTQESGIAGLLLHPASCTWAAAFVEADRARSGDGRAEAAAGLTRIHDALVATGKDSAAQANRDRAAAADASWIAQLHEQCQTLAADNARAVDEK